MFRVVKLALLIIGLFSISLAASAEELDPGGTFIDDDNKYYEGSVEAIFAANITNGCSDRQQFCGEHNITRAELAAMLARALKLPAASTDYFNDDNGSIFEGAINKIAEAGITQGCNPPTNDRFCPDREVSREELATLFVRAFNLPATTQTDRFVDDDESVHERGIDRLAAANITVGCNPPENDRFCPTGKVIRGDLAVFLTRAIPLTAIKPPPRPPTHLVSRFTTYHNCCESRVTNIQKMAREVDEWIVLPWEEFNLWDVIGPPRRSEGYVAAPILINGQGYCCDHPLNIGGGTSQFGTTLYNAIYWGAYDEVQHKPHSKYISRYPVGIEATLGYPNLNVRFINDTWTPIRINTYYSSRSITVEFWGNNDGRTVIGRHSGGRTTATVTSSGGADARRVTSSVTGPVPGTVTIRRTITDADGSETETWTHTYTG